MTQEVFCTWTYFRLLIGRETRKHAVRHRAVWLPSAAAGLSHGPASSGSIALSSGEAEYYAMVKAAAEGLGIQTLMRDLGWEVVVRILGRQHSRESCGIQNRPW